MFQSNGIAKRACRLALLGLALMTASASAAPRDGVMGQWLTQGGEDVVEIAPCGDGGALCGRIVGIARPPGDPIPTNARGASQCGLILISDERPSGPDAWLGKITDPRNDRTYRAKLWLDGKGGLRLRGFIGISLLGRSQTWSRFTGRLTKACEVLSARSETRDALAGRH